MIATATLTPALTMAQTKTRDARHAVNQGGMIQVIATYRRDSQVTATSRKLDRMLPIDAAVNALAAAWVHPMVPVWVTLDPLVVAVLNACTKWLDDGKYYGCGHRITGWRTSSVKNLYWQAAWAYNFKQYSIAAHGVLVANNAAGNLTSVDVALPAGVVNPFTFAASGYQMESVPAAVLPPVAAHAPAYRAIAAGNPVRGDTRGPLNIQAANGFQPRSVAALGAYSPWFNGAAGDDTISVTNDQFLTINAGKAGKTTGGHRPVAAHVPAWMIAAAGGIGLLRAFIYEIDTGAPANGCRLNTEPAGREDIYLGLPAAVILNWWALKSDGTTYGPIAFPAPVNDPVLNWSIANRLG